MNHLVNHIAECCKRLDIRPDETLEPAKPVSDTESVCMTGGTRYFYCVVPCTF